MSRRFFHIQSYMNRNISVKSIQQRISWQTVLFSPISNTLSFVIICIISIITSISYLFFSGIPFTIIKRVIAIIIYSIYTCIVFSKFFNMFKIRFIHIITKINKNLPSFADFNSTISIIFKNFNVFIKTTGIYSAPYIIKSSLCHSMYIHKLIIPFMGIRSS